MKLRLICFSLICLSFFDLVGVSIAQTLTEGRYLQTAAIRQEVLNETYLGSFEIARLHLLSTLAFMEEQIVPFAGRPVETVFNPFGSVDPSAFAMLDAQEVISVGLESFGSSEGIHAALDNHEDIHQSVANFAALGFFRNDPKHPTSDLSNRPMGADLIGVLHHVFRARNIEVRIHSKDHASVTFDLRGKNRKFSYFRSDLSGQSPVNPQFLETLKNQKIDAIFRKATLTSADAFSPNTLLKMVPSVWETLQGHSETLWIGEGLTQAKEYFQVTEGLRIQLRANWTNTALRAVVPVARLVPKDASFKEKKSAWPLSWIFASTPKQRRVLQPKRDVCPQVLKAATRTHLQQSGNGISNFHY